MINTVGCAGTQRCLKVWTPMISVCALLASISEKKTGRLGLSASGTWDIVLLADGGVVGLPYYVTYGSCSPSKPPHFLMCVCERP